MAKTTTTKKKLKNPELAKAAGRRTLIKLDWQDWKKVHPKSGTDIYAVVKFNDGYLVDKGTYFDETLPANGPFKESRWREFRSLNGDLIWENPADRKRLVAWAEARLLTEGVYFQ